MQRKTKETENMNTDYSYSETYSDNFIKYAYYKLKNQDTQLAVLIRLICGYHLKPEEVLGITAEDVHLISGAPCISLRNRASDKKWQKCELNRDIEIDYELFWTLICLIEQQNKELEKAREQGRRIFCSADNIIPGGSQNRYIFLRDAGTCICCLSRHMCMLSIKRKLSELIYFLQKGISRM